MIEQIFQIKETAKIKLNQFAASVVKWSKRLVLASVFTLGVAATASWFTADVLVQHAHNVYSAAKLVYGEAKGESRAGQKAVYGSIMNRVAYRQFPDTMHAVIFQPYSTTDKILQYNAMGDTLHEDLSTELGQTILRRVAWWYLQERLGIFSAPKEARGAHSYCTPEACERQKAYFGRLKRIGQIGNHVFYRDCNEEESATVVTENNIPPKIRPVPRPANFQSIVQQSRIAQAIAMAVED